MATKTKATTGRTLKATRVSDAPFTMRLHPDVLRRLDDLIPMVAADGDTATILGGVNRSSVVRLALVEGVRLLEKRYGKTAD
jgi:hypothetical protein